MILTYCALLFFFQLQYALGIIRITVLTHQFRFFLSEIVLRNQHSASYAYTICRFRCGFFTFFATIGFRCGFQKIIRRNVEQCT